MCLDISDIRSDGRVARHEFRRMHLAGRTFVRFGDWPFGGSRHTSRVASQMSRLCSQGNIYGSYIKPHGWLTFDGATLTLTTRSKGQGGDDNPESYGNVSTSPVGMSPCPVALLLYIVDHRRSYMCRFVCNARSCGGITSVGFSVCLAE